MRRETMGSGISVLSQVRWGTHLCLLYESRQDLVDILVPYFQTGMQNNELCLWAASDPLGAEDARAALEKVVTNLDDHIKNGRVEIVDCGRWYNESGHFRPDKVLDFWVAKERQAIEKGFDGLRFAGDACWPEQRDWRGFSDHEAAVDDMIGKHRMIAICCYSLDKYGASEAVDLAAYHQFVLIRRSGKWEIIQSAGRKRAERALQQARHLVERTFDSMVDAVFVLDAVSTQIVDCNRAASDIFGYAYDEMIGRRTDFLHNDEQALKAFRKQLDSSIEENGFKQMHEFAMRRKDGTAFPTEHGMVPLEDGQGERIGWVNVVRDISKRKQAQEALAESEHRYRTLFQNSGDAIYITTREGSFVDVNQSALDLFGYSREELMELNAQEMYHDPADRERFRQEIERFGSVRDYEVKLRNKTGKELDCILSASLRQAEDGGVLGYQGIIRDVTHRRRLEAELQRAQRMESVGTLAGGIAHDFNNLLMAIQGNVSLMMFDIDTTSPYYRFLSNIRNEVKSGAELTAQLLGYARKGKYYVKNLNLSSLVEKTAEIFGTTRKEISIEKNLADDLFVVKADENQIKQVLFNLFINAADAMPDGGDLTLKTANVSHERVSDKFYDARPGHYVLLTVTDTGKGMNKETMERIFEPFFTTKEMGRGTGLGLASTYGIISGHGGYIDVESEEGKGTTFSIYLPATQKKLRRTAQSAQNIVRGTGAILLVDDEERVLQVGTELLQKLGYTVLGAKSGNEALNIFVENKDEIDLIILDMVMPNMSGGEAYDKMKKINPRIKVLLSSGYGLDRQAKEILKRGCDAFIQKPFDIQQLSVRVSEILGN